LRANETPKILLENYAQQSRKRKTLLNSKKYCCLPICVQ